MFSIMTSSIKHCKLVNYEKLANLVAAKTPTWTDTLAYYRIFTLQIPNVLIAKAPEFVLG
jgi:hypothetical protein